LEHQSCIMETNVVTERFLTCLEELKSSSRIKSYRQFALSIDIHPQSLNDITKHKRNATVEMLRKAIELYHINPIYLYCGEKPFFRQPGLETTDQDESSLKSFEIIGDEMEPNLFNGDKVACTQIEEEDWMDSIYDNHVYVLVCNNRTYIRRVKVMENLNVLELHTDNNYYQPKTIDLKNVQEIWQVQTKISPFMSSKNHLRNGFNENILTMKETITSQSDLIKTLNSTIEKLLKQSRSSI